MRRNNVVGFIFSSYNEELVSELTAKRTMGSVPFGGRYRLIDFPLSNMVNSGISKIGVATKSNYTSLMDHLGSGKVWNMSRRRGGLVLMPPFANNNGSFNTRIETLYALHGFIEHSSEEYVLLCDCDEVYNIPYQQMIREHIKSGADITVAYKHGVIPDRMRDPLVIHHDDDELITEMLIRPTITGECDFALNTLIISKELLLQLISDCVSKNLLNFKRDILQKNVGKLKIRGYRFDGFLAVISSTKAYFDANMALMNPDVRQELFNKERPIYTKIRDDMPTKYGLMSSVKNSLIAQGCVIEGEVTNSIIFKGVHIAKNAKVSNCVIMQDTVISENSNLSYVICDKDVNIRSDRAVTGFLTYPVYISKASIV